MIGVVNYKAGNAASVIAALNSIAIPCKLVNTPAEIKAVTHIILPGVGSAGATMASLNELNLVPILTEQVIHQHKPFFGICVGLQILFKTSTEGNATCLGWLDGEVDRLKGDQIRVPHIGWNTVRQERPHPIFEGIDNLTHFYYVNSYRAQTPDKSIVLGSTTYGETFPGVVGKDNILATQFHAEKSGELGLALLANFYKTR